VTTAAPPPLYSVSQLTTPHNSFAEDVEQIARTGADGIGIWEGKLGAASDDEAVAATMARAGLRASLCFPAIWSFYPNAFAMEPASPDARVELIVASIERLAGFAPACVVVTPGTAPPGVGEDESMEVVRRGMSRVLEAATASGAPVALEPIRKSSGGVVHSFSQSLEIRAELGAPELGVVFDVWHLWDEPGVRDLLAANLDALVGVQVCDWRDPMRGWTDRALPGEGAADLVGLVRHLIASGYRGWYDLEIFSDDGTLVTSYPDSLWQRPHEELLALGRARFDDVYEAAAA
jgi:sugar phosphate isomerase/epimerase